LFATPDSKSQPDLISTRIPSHVIQVPVTQTNLFATPKSESVRVASHVVQMPITQKTFPVNPKAVVASVSCAQVHFDMFVHDPVKCMYISQGLLRGGWECSTITNIINIMNQKIDGQDAYFMDIGSNIGAFSLNVAHKGFNVVAFEAMTYNIELQRASIGTFPPSGNLVLFQTAVSSTDGASMCIAAAKGGNPLKNTGNGQLTQGCEPAAEHVSVRSIDSILTHEGMNTKCFTVVKADIEGFEALAFQGASNIFQGRCPPCFVFFEYIEKYTIMATNSSESPFKVLSSYGYACTSTNKKYYVCNMKKHIHSTRCSKNTDTSQKSPF
jgi:FkbM family methyltransferase